MRSTWMWRVAATVTAAGLLAACGSAAGGGDSRTYTDPDDLALLAVPSDWNLYEYPELTAVDPLPFTGDRDGLDFPAVTSTGFDGSPVRDVGNLSADLAVADYPIGSMSVRTIGPDERDFVSRFLLTQSVVPYRSYPQPQEITKEDFSFGQGYDGVRVLVAFGGADGSGTGVAYLISVTDPADERLYSVVAGCSRECFIENQDTIEDVVDSWLINTRD